MIVVSWRGRTWGDWGSSTAVLRAPGLEDWKASAANIAGGGQAGATTAPLFAAPGAPVLELLVMADSDEAMAMELDDIRAATYHEDEMEVFPFRWQVAGEDPRTVWARCSDRQIPSDWTTVDRLRQATVQIALEANDPKPYSDQVEVTFSGPGVDHEITVPGWASSRRWQWIGHGPLTNPRLTLSVDGFDDQVMRLVGTVNDGQNLNVVSTPTSLVTTVGGFDRRSDFDGGVHTQPAQWFTLPAGPVTVTFGGAGDGDALFRFVGARP